MAKIDDAVPTSGYSSTVRRSLLMNGGAPISKTNPLPTDADASIDYYNGSSWTNYSGTLSNLITTNAWLSKVGNYLVFSLTSGEVIAKIKIFDGVKR